MRTAIWGITLLGIALAPVPAYADTVCEWFEFGGKIAEKSAPPPNSQRGPEHGRATTQMALAMFEALNAIDRRYESYVGLDVGDARASQTAAAITAAYEVLTAHFPGQKTTLDENYSLALAGEADAVRRDAGVAIGKRAAEAALAKGGIDDKIVQSPYRPRTKSGEWIGAALPVFEPFDIAYKPWALASVDQVRPAPPPALTSEVYARDLAEVQRLGGRNSKDRTPEQTLMARYRITPSMMPAMRQVLDASGRKLVDNARIIALAEMVSDDAYMATGAAKLHYNFWRPVTALRNADQDSNDATMIDPTWTPLIATPNHPEYPCGHCTYAGAAAEVMKSVTGNEPASGVRVASRSLTDAAVQTLPSWDEWVSQVSFSRILGGVHYRFSNDAGEKVGRDTARIGLKTLMQPLPKARQRPAVS